MLLLCAVRARLATTRRARSKLHKDKLGEMSHLYSTMSVSGGASRTRIKQGDTQLQTLAVGELFGLDVSELQHRTHAEQLVLAKVSDSDNRCVSGGVITESLEGHLCTNRNER